MLPVQMRCCAGEPQRVSKECQPGPTTPASRPAGSDRVRTKTSGGLYLARHEKRLEFLRNVRGPVRDVKVADHKDEHLDERIKGRRCGLGEWRHVPGGLGTMCGGARAEGRHSSEHLDFQRVNLGASGLPPPDCPIHGCTTAMDFRLDSRVARVLL